MSRIVRSFIWVAVAVAVAVVGALCWSAIGPASPDPAASTATHGAPGRERAPGPLLGPVDGFVPNRGQWPADLRFCASAPGVAAALGTGALSLVLDGVTPLRLCFEGADPTAPVDGHGRRREVCHFLRGADPAGWVRDVPVYDAVVQRALYAGVDLRLRRSGSTLEYDLLLGPGADLSSVACRVDGAERVWIEPTDGSLRIAVGTGVLRQPAPIAWRGGVPVECAFVQLDERRFGFRTPEGAGGEPDWIDPQLQWSTYLGGTDRDDGYSVAATTDDAVVIGGTTLSPNFPTTTGAWDETYNGSVSQPRPYGDVFAAKFRGDGQLLFATFLGGTENEALECADDAPGGDVVLGGWTSSTDFPVTQGAYDTTHNGTDDGYRFLGGDLFVTRLSSDGRSLRFSTFIGGSRLEYPRSMFVEPDGAVTIAGHVHSPDFPTTPGAFQRTIIGSSDGFVTRLDPTGSSLVFSTYFGGTDGEEYMFGLAVDAQGGTVFAGQTDSSDLPVTAGAWDTTYNGGTEHAADGYVGRLDPTGGSLIFCSYLGGPGNEHVRRLALEPDGTFTVTGQTSGGGFPTTPGAFDTTFNGGGWDAFATRFRADGSGLEWSTLLGGGDRDVGNAIVSVGGGRVVVGGFTDSSDFPTTPGAFQTTNSGGSDVFLAELSANGDALFHATMVGGRFGEWAQHVVGHPHGDLFAGGTSYSPDFPTTPGAFDRTSNGNGDAYVMRIAMLPDGCERYGHPTPSCSGDIPILGTRSAPNRGASDFALTATASGGSTGGVLFLGLLERNPPLTLVGVDWWLDPAGLIAAFAIPADSHGGALAPLPVPDDQSLVGARLVAQFAWPSACRLYASAGMRIEIRP